MIAGNSNGSRHPVPVARNDGAMDITRSAIVTLKNVDIKHLKLLHEKIHLAQLELNADSNAWETLEQISPLIFVMWCIANECTELIPVENPY